MAEKNSAAMFDLLSDSGLNSLRKLFVARMRRDGRGQEWYDRLRVRREQHGERHSVAASKVMKEMGFVSEAEERRLALEHLDNLHKRAGTKEVERMDAEVTEDVIRHEFDDALKRLPTRADPGVELDWIRNHPAMNRLDRDPDKKVVLLTGEDILDAPNGAAPSQYAANALQHWVNYPNEFFKQLISVQKTKAGSEGPGEQVVEDDLSEVESLLRQVKV